METSTNLFTKQKIKKKQLENMHISRLKKRKFKKQMRVRKPGIKEMKYEDLPSIAIKFKLVCKNREKEARFLAYKIKYPSL